jgi:hypothetical protein
MSQEIFNLRYAALAALSTAFLLGACAAPAPAPKPAPPPPVVVAPPPAVVAPAPAPVAAAPSKPAWWQVMPSGRVQCELGQSMELKNVAPGSNVDVVWQGVTHKLQNVPTSSGAYRYEDRNSGVVLIHIPAKMMLMNQKQGKRLADECRI